MVSIKDIPAVKTLRKPAIFAAIAPLALVAGCQQSPAPAPGETAVGAGEVAGPDAKPGISASEGRLMLPIVAGGPAAVYFTVRNDGTAPASLAGVHVAGAGKAEMHKTEGNSMSPVESVDVAPGAALAFAPGSYHVMAFELSDDLKPGGTAELTLTFSDGDKLSMPLAIEKMGGDMGHDMGGHDGGMKH